MDKKIENEKGVIAESYSELQSIPALEKANLVFPVPKASDKSVSKALLQAFEVGVLNLIDLLTGVVGNLKRGELGKCSVKLEWYRDFNFLIGKITNTLLAANFHTEIEKLKTIDFSQIESLVMLAQRLQEYDKTSENLLNKNNIDSHEVIANQSLDADLAQIFHCTKVTNYEITVWENNLARAVIPIENVEYKEFIGFQWIYYAVNETRLAGDTFFTQFRGLHQIPEILTAELNDHIEEAVILLRGNDLEKCSSRLRTANSLLEIVLASLKPIVNNLTTSDYHQIRENLGLTSGSHSVNIHYHLFRDIYQQITAEFVATHFSGDQDYLDSVSNSFGLKALENELLNLSNLTFHWRNMHLHLPRNNVGSSFTKSLVGSSDAVDAVKKMRISAERLDPLLPVKSLYQKAGIDTKTPLKDYIESEDSFDSFLLKTTGEVTQKRFPDVQNRTGIFAKGTPFVPPDKRKV